MKFHKPLVNSIVQTIHKIFEEGVYADKAVEQALKQNSKWGSRDRKFIAENVYEIVRWWRLFSEILKDENASEKMNYYKVFAVNQILKTSELPDWEEFSGINKMEILQKAEQLKRIRRYRESIPDWLDELGCAELGESSWEKELSKLNEEAKVILRVNNLKTTKTHLQRLFQEQSTETEIIDSFPDALILIRRKNLYQLEEYKHGLFEIQDASSQLIAPFMQLQSGMTVIDACAGAGGKSLHIATLMKNEGKVISMDVEEKKLIELKKRNDRAGIKIIQTHKINSETVSQFKNSADRLLLDVPCSGLGVLRRNPDAKWKLNLNFIEDIKKTQQKILCEYSQMLKLGGIIVYATCSILPSENEKQIEKFLNSEKKFEFMNHRKVLPSDGFDGFYMAAIKKIK